MEDAVAQWYRNPDDFMLLLQPMKRLQYMMTKLCGQGYLFDISESFPDTDSDSEIVLAQCSKSVVPLHEASEPLVLSGTSSNTGSTCRKVSTRLCNKALPKPSGTIRLKERDDV